ncbi:MAG: hypothetical protein K9K30_03165 [Burkholderiaceae bacterium]|nr:hypothetical protein [Burkholderiaceae bacterium]MCF8184172.1 hypothetical protein [Polynucleobacter sp.]
MLLPIFQAAPSYAGSTTPARERLQSCNPAFVLAAAEEIIRAQETLKEPLELFSPAAVLFQQGKKDEAVFWFYAAQLRTRYQLAFEKGDRGQLLTIMMMTIGVPINNYAFQDTANFLRILDRVLEWDRTTPNPFRDQPKSELANQQVEKIYSGLTDLKAKLIAEKADIEGKARQAAPEIEQAYSLKGNRACRDIQPMVDACSFPGLSLPPDVAVFAAGAYAGRPISFQIDQSGSASTQIDVTVNAPGKPVVLILGAYSPAIWSINWTERTKIIAVLVGGYHRQLVAGLESGVPTLISTYDNKGPCGGFYVEPHTTREDVSQLSSRAFNRPVDNLFHAENGRVVVGDPVPTDIKLISSPDTTPESYYDKNAPLAGLAGIEDAISKGFLRNATLADLDAWYAAIDKAFPPTVNQGPPKPRMSSTFRKYVVLKPFTYPAGLYGGNSGDFLIPKGVPKPDGNPGHSTTYDLNGPSCQGPSCTTR